MLLVEIRDIHIGSILFIKVTFVAIGAKQKSRCPGRSSAHLLANSVKGHPSVRFDDEFIVDVGNDTAAPQSVHGIGWFIQIGLT